MIPFDGQKYEEYPEVRPVYQRVSAATDTKMVCPDGTLCLVPNENVEAASAEGWRRLTGDILEAMHNRLFLAQKFFEEKHPRITNWRLPRGKGRW